MKRKVLFINKAHPYLEQRLTQLGFECELDEESSKTELEAKINAYFGIVIRSRVAVDRSLLEQAKNVSFVAREGVGT